MKNKRADKIVNRMSMLIEKRPDVEIKVHLITWEDDEKLPELIDRLDDIKDDMATFGIEFDYTFRDFYDRQITTDDGWTINLGRGLDIYDKYNAFSVASGRQDLRKCKEFRIAYMRTSSTRTYDESK